MIAAWCFQCGLDYAEDVAECVECGVPTVDYARTSTEHLDPDAAQLAYELHAWNGDARVAVERLLHAEHLRHDWQGPTLVVHEDDEDRIDAIIEQVDDEMTTELGAAKEAEDGRIGFDLGARNEELHRMVLAALDDAGIEHELMGNGFLLVPTELEDEIGDIIENAQAELRGSEVFGAGVEGVAAHEVVESLFVAADVLRRNPRDLRQQRQFREQEELARRLGLPFGYEAPMWRSVLDTAAELVAHIEADSDDGIEESARALRNALHPYV